MHNKIHNAQHHRPHKQYATVELEIKSHISIFKTFRHYQSLTPKEQYDAQKNVEWTSIGKSNYDSIKLESYRRKAERLSYSNTIYETRVTVKEADMLIIQETYQSGIVNKKSFNEILNSSRISNNTKKTFIKSQKS